MEIPKEALRHFAIRDEIELQTDRGAALVATAYLDERLRQAIRALLSDGIASVMDGGETVEARLFERSGPLATFSGKINLAFALGFFGPVSHRDLHLIRKIRNHFAHSPDPGSFDDPPVADWSRELRLPDWCHPGANEPSPVQPRSRFLWAIRLLHDFLWTEMCKRDLVGDGRNPPSPQVLI